MRTANIGDGGAQKTEAKNRGAQNPRRTLNGDDHWCHVHVDVSLALEQVIKTQEHILMSAWLSLLASFANMSKTRIQTQ